MRWTAETEGLGIRFTTASICKAKERSAKIKSLRATIATLTCVLVGANGKLRTAGEILQVVQSSYHEHHREAVMLFGEDATEATIDRDLKAMHMAEVRDGHV